MGSGNSTFEKSPFKILCHLPATNFGFHVGESVNQITVASIVTSQEISWIYLELWISPRNISKETLSVEIIHFNLAEVVAVAFNHT